MRTLLWMYKHVAHLYLQADEGKPHILQILNHKAYGAECDMWSIGVITWVLLVGTWTPATHKWLLRCRATWLTQVFDTLAGFPPFDGDTDADIMDAVRNETLK